MRWIAVIAVSDIRLDAANACVSHLRAVYGPDAPIGVGAYRAPSEPVPDATAEWAADNGFPLALIEPNDFLTADDHAEWHVCELLEKFQVVKAFVDMGYDEIYMLHSDSMVIADFRPAYADVAQGGGWSFIGSLYHTRACDDLDEARLRGGEYWRHRGLRFYNVCLMVNPDFIRALFANYLTISKLWKLFRQWPMVDDLAMFDFGRPMLGFEARVLPTGLIDEYAIHEGH